MTSSSCNAWVFAVFAVMPSQGYRNNFLALRVYGNLHTNLSSGSASSSSLDEALDSERNQSSYLDVSRKILGSFAELTSTYLLERQNRSLPRTMLFGIGVLISFLLLCLFVGSCRNQISRPATVVKRERNKRLEDAIRDTSIRITKRKSTLPTITVRDTDKEHVEASEQHGEDDCGSEKGDIPKPASPEVPVERTCQRCDEHRILSSAFEGSAALTWGSESDGLSGTDVGSYRLNGPRVVAGPQRATTD